MNQNTSSTFKLYLTWSARYEEYKKMTQTKKMQKKRKTKVWR